MSEISEEQKLSAQQEKDAGTAAYKKQDFEAAIQHYDKAAELDPTDMIFPLNKAAVYLQKKDYENCIATCHKAIEVGQENRADFQKLAKAYARIAKAYQAQEKYEDSLHFYDKALANHRDQDYVKQRKAIEKVFKEQQRLAYIDPAKSEEAKKRGNDFFREGKFPEAVQEYTEAINRNPEDAKLYSNRAAAYTKLATWDLALKDCDECIQRDPAFIKGYLRKGTILLGLKKTSEAEKAFREALKLQPSHAEAMDGIRKCNEQNFGSGLSQEERAKQAMQDPEIQGILADPVMQQILQQMSEDPKALAEHMKNPDIATKITKLAQSGILSFR
eukprot:gene8813-1178_t